MNVERLLALFDRVSEAPDAVPKLRRFVLDLAVRGKLVEQDPADEPVEELLSAITSEKLTLFKRGEIRKPSPRAVVDENSHPFPAPPGWCWVSLSDILLKLTDGTHHSPPNHPTGDYRYITAKNIKREGIILKDVTFVSADVHREIYSRCNPERGDILYIKDGATTGVVTINNLDEPFSLLSSVALLKVPKSLFNRLIVEFLRSPFFYNQMRGFMKGAAITRVTLKRMGPALFPLPPLTEQHRIVARVDELMTLCDQLEAARTERERRRDRLTVTSLARLSTPDPETFQKDGSFALATLSALTAQRAQLRPLRQTILNLAVRGKLVPQIASEEPAIGLLKRIAYDKRLRAVSARDRRADSISPIDPASLSFGVPPSWVCVRFGDVTISRDSERIPVSKDDRKGKANIYDYYGASGVIDKIDEYLFDAPLLLIGEDGANLINRSTPIAFIARGKYWVNNHAHVLDGLSEDYLRYLALFINAIDLKPFITGTAQPKMNQAKMNEIPIALPPLAEQRRIVARVDELMALCDQLEASLKGADTANARLLDSLLHEALDGPPEAEAA